MSTIALSINGLSTLIKSQWLLEWIKNHKLSDSFYKSFPLNVKTQINWKQVDGKKIYHAYSMPKKVGMTVLISGCLVIKRKEKKQGYFINIKCSVFKEYIQSFMFMHLITELQNIWSKSWQN